MPAKTAQPASQNRNAANGPKLPVKTLRLGRIKATVWETLSVARAALASLSAPNFLSSR